MNDQELHAYCEDWVNWCLSRKYYLVPGAKNILARMQPSRNAPIKDGKLSADLNWFNMAIHTLADMNDENAGPFITYYCYRKKNIKVEAARLECSRQTFYRRVNRFARDAHAMAKSLKTAHEAMPQEEEMTD